MNSLFHTQWVTTALLFASLILPSVLESPLHKPGMTVFDQLQKWTAKSQPPGVALVLLNQHSLDAFEQNEGLTFPLPRQVFGAVATVAKAAGAKAIFFDIIFSESSSHGVEDDQIFAQLLNESELPIYMSAQSKTGTTKEPTSTLRKGINHLNLVGLHLPKSNESVLRAVPTHVPGVDGPIPSVSEGIYRNVFGGEAEAKKWIRSYHLETFPFVPLYNVLLAYRQLEEGKGLSPEFLPMKNRVWIVGYSAPGLHDLKPLPTDAQAPGSYVHATGIANRLQQTGLDSSPFWLTALLSLSLAVLITVLLRYFATPMPATAGLVFVLVIFSVLSTLSLWQLDLWVNPLVLFLTGGFVGGGQLTWKYQVQWKDRLKLARSLQASMSPEMVELIRSGDVKVSRYGEDTTITTFFSDLAGFTSLSEQMPSRQLVDLLNDYLDQMVDLIVRNNGYVDKFIGDAVMAFWGAPVPEENHAKLGLQAVREVDGVMTTFNQHLKEKGIDVRLESRIGLHVGPVIVGNIGAKNRHNYTAIGDTVNLAARLESLSKQYRCSVLISEDVVKAAGAENEPDLLEVDQVRVKGRSEPTRIFTLMEDPSNQFEIYNKGLSAYYQGQWELAQAAFAKVLDLSPASVLKERCDHALLHGTPSQWIKGVWSHDSK